MNWVQNKCPDCGQPPNRILESVDGFAGLQSNDEGGFCYDGNTDMKWDNQDSVVKAGRNILMCENGHIWESRPETESGEKLPENNEHNRELLAGDVVEAADIGDTLEMATQSCIALYELDDEKFLQDWENTFHVREQDGNQTENKTESKE